MRIVCHLQLPFERPPRADANRHANGVIHFANYFDAVAIRVLDDGVAVGD